MFAYIFFRIAVLSISLIPFSWLYKISDVLALFFQYVYPYRKKVIIQNLQKAFPEKSKEEIDTILKKSYQNLSDILLEGIKGMTSKESELIKRYQFRNPELVSNLFNKGQSVIGLVAHYNNWEWGAFATAGQIKGPVIGISKPIKNKYIDRFIRQNRARYGTEVIHMQETARSLVKHKDSPSLFVLIADQSPSNTKNAYWLDFLNQDTACINGPDKIAQRTDYPAIYFDVQRQRRGYYTIEASLLHQNPSELPPGALTKLYMDKLEQIIRQKPENWLWSHRRWKRKRHKT